MKKTNEVIAENLRLAKIREEFKKKGYRNVTFVHDGSRLIIIPTNIKKPPGSGIPKEMPHQNSVKPDTDAVMGDQQSEPIDKGSKDFLSEYEKIYGVNNCLQGVYIENVDMVYQRIKNEIDEFIKRL